MYKTATGFEQAAIEDANDRPCAWKSELWRSTGAAKRFKITWPRQEGYRIPEGMNREICA
jgi:hypothetical protein